VELTEAANAIREKLVEHQISRPEKDWEARFILNYPSCLLFDYPFDLRTDMIIRPVDPYPHQHFLGACDARNRGSLPDSHAAVPP
jgi:hypothetical protein